ncbi:DUF4123 domain-containing protein [Caballeronia sp. LZ025]|uniref:DUF4123 domain-containing protein n=1 Tax=Caballeronia TaxID=1827195 RepID=UPI001FD4DEA8|nr:MULTISPECIES: DUF4123 domain-containing protein [Caballeronia]MDR5735841.1 DUF4123 domain-containing protein [Caballeronia sp. LZ025]
MSAVSSIVSSPDASHFEDGFLLADPGALPPEISTSSFPSSLCIPTNWGRDFTGLPMVISLADCDASQREWLASIAEHEANLSGQMPLTHAGVCAHLTATASLAQIALHIARQLVVLPVDAERRRSGAPSLWRFFDPRVFTHLCWLLDVDEQCSLVGPVSAWAFPWFGRWYRFQNPFPIGINEDYFSQLTPSGFRQIEWGMWGRAQRVSQINQVLARLSLPEGYTWQQQTYLAAIIEKALQAANSRLNFAHTGDQMRYAEHVARHGDAFETHPKLKEYWRARETRMASGGWTEVSELLTNDVYAQLPERTPNRASSKNEPALV